ncbi:hypothetical protein LAUMK35_04575 [Mycobacterium pseudokansasii]|uniref:Uncharacterized protein n=1 Tax=Mycobacterium pseudokansasii TaxID=2341080 RepID=A0A498QWR5_9MYCO|nr:hypothetical protein LAUMK35_04575 [Mycobacterium pseudokansasii]VBA31464.1 hypothetical protein LAUMK21_04568 [Mycobacterium pseudokansasii]VBA54067.1 hypothetical protein LAUMK142_04474 [Mycobacterium pseudokansasii]
MWQGIQGRLGRVALGDCTRPGSPARPGSVRPVVHPASHRTPDSSTRAGVAGLGPGTGEVAVSGCGAVPRCGRGKSRAGAVGSVAEGTECAPMAPSVRWRRRLCRPGGRSWTFPPSMHSQRRHRTLDTTPMTADTVSTCDIPRLPAITSGLSEGAVSACRKQSQGVPRARHPRLRKKTSLTSRIRDHHEFPSEVGKKSIPRNQ